MIRIGGSIDATERAAVNFIERFSGLDFESRNLISDVSDPRLPLRLRGDIILVAENLRDDGVAAFLTGMHELADSCKEPETAALVIEDCAELFTIYRKRRS